MLLQLPHSIVRICYYFFFLLLILVLHSFCPFPFLLLPLLLLLISREKIINLNLKKVVRQGAKEGEERIKNGYKKKEEKTKAKIYLKWKSLSRREWREISFSFVFSKKCNPLSFLSKSPAVACFWKKPLKMCVCYVCSFHFLLLSHDVLVWILHSSQSSLYISDSSFITKSSQMDPNVVSNIRFRSQEILERMSWQREFWRSLQNPGKEERIFVRSPSETFHLIQCYASLADNGHYSSLILSLMEICFSFPETLQSLFQVINFNPCDFTLDSSLKETEGDPCLALFMSWDYTFPTYLSYNASHKSLWLTVCSPL